MPAERMSMRKIRDALRLTHAMGTAAAVGRRGDGDRQNGGSARTCGARLRRISAGRSRTRLS